MGHAARKYTELVKKGRAEAIEQGYQKAQAERQAVEKRLQAMVLNMVQAGLPDSQVMSIAQITADELATIKERRDRNKRLILIGIVAEKVAIENGSFNAALIASHAST